MFILYLSYTCLKSWWTHKLIILPRYHMNNTRITPCLRLFYSMTGQTGENPKEVKSVPTWTPQVSRGCCVSKLKYQADRSLKVCICLSRSSSRVPCAKPVYSLCYQALSLVVALGTSALKTRKNFGGCRRDIQCYHKCDKIWAYCSTTPKFRLIFLLSSFESVYIWHVYYQLSNSSKRK